ncbi:MAG: SDR family oxidoreductase [Alphaproteobacteria bacterium]|nr:SDR family oxidoreductase [Rhodospirillales bacterium]MCW9046301.1 SDR family oxidoreductase [Alphaproteobacteria bacterium]
MGKLDGRVAIITGGGTGIGKGIAEAFAQEGATVVLASRNKGNLEQVASTIVKAGGQAISIPTDVSKEADVQSLFAHTIEAFGKVDVLVNNSGFFGAGPIDEMSLNTWQTTVDVNLTGAFLCSREAFRTMKQNKGGRIINIGSVSAKVPRPNSAPYTSTKFALEGLTRSLALDGREHGIAVSILQPGNTDTAIWENNPSGASVEGVMAISEVAAVAVVMAALDPSINMFEALMLPMSMPYLGRG